MPILKRTQWTESDVLALPAEHDYFDQKSGADFTVKRDHFLGFVAKALSAFANSGGGHLILGMHDDGVTFDGLPLAEGRTSVREWLEQKIPNLLAYELQDFRVHEVIPSAPTTIPAGKVIVVIDIGDSALAPHQSTHGTRNYYMRQGGHSVIAPHHYLEILRQRVQGPVLNVTDVSVSIGQPYLSQVDEIIQPVYFNFSVKNDGRIAAYKWSLYPFSYRRDDAKRDEDFTWGDNMPMAQGQTIRSGSIKIDTTILPGMSDSVRTMMGIRLNPQHRDFLPDIHHEAVLATDTAVTFRIATETSPGEPFEIKLTEYLDSDGMAHAVHRLVRRL